MTAEENAPYDLFVVYAEPDTRFVTTYLLPALGLARERVLLSGELTLGAPVLAEIERGVTRSHLTLVVLSGAYLADPQAVFGEQLAAHINVSDTRLIPLVLDACELPLRLRRLVTLDFRDQARWQESVERLRARLDQREPPEMPSPSPYLEYKPKLRFSPPLLPPYFRGRQKEQKALLKRVHERCWCGLFDVGGAGKTTLAASVAAQVLAQRCAEVVWLQVGDEVGLEIVLESFAKAVGETLASVPDQRQRYAFLRAVTRQRGLYIVLDDVNRNDVLEALLSSVGEGNAVLVTGRDQGLESVLIHGLEVTRLEPLSPDDALGVLHYVSGASVQAAENEAWRALAMALGGSPLALVLVAAEMRFQPRPEPRHYLDEAISPGALGRGNLPSALASRTIAALEGDTARVFDRLGVFEGHGFDADAIAAVCELPGPAVEGALSALLRRMLLVRGPQGVLSLHPVLRRLARERLRMSPANYAEAITRHTRHYQRLLHQFGGYEWNIQKYPLLVPHEREVVYAIRLCLRRWEEGDQEVADMAVAMVFYASWYLHWRGYLSLRDELCHRVIEKIDFAMVPEEQANMTGNICVDRGWVELERGNVESARRLALRASTLLGDVDSKFAGELLAQVEFLSGAREQALASFETISESAVMGSRSWFVFSIRKADVLYALGRFGEHDALLERMLNMPENLRGEVADVRAMLLCRSATRGQSHDGPSAARALLEDAVGLFERTGNVTGERVMALCELSSRLSGEHARRLLEEALKQARTLGLTDLAGRVEALWACAYGSGPPER